MTEFKENKDVRRPFLSTPDPRVYFPASAVDKARRSVYRCLRRGEGVALVVGAPGTGKTLLARALASEFAAEDLVSVVSIPKRSDVKSFFKQFMFGLGGRFDGRDETEMRLTTLDFLAKSPKRRCVLLVDDAHNLSPRMFDELGRLVDQSAGASKQLSVALFGANALEDRLNLPQLYSFQQRIVIRSYLDAFTCDETCRFIDAEMKRSGLAAAFTQEAKQAAARLSLGSPRVTTQLCDRALWLASEGAIALADEKESRALLTIDAREIERAWNNLQNIPEEEDELVPALEPGAPVVEFGLLEDDEDDEVEASEPNAAAAREEEALEEEASEETEEESSEETEEEEEEEELDKEAEAEEYVDAETRATWRHTESYDPRAAEQTVTVSALSSAGASEEEEEEEAQERSEELVAEANEESEEAVQPALEEPVAQTETVEFSTELDDEDDQPAEKPQIAAQVEEAAEVEEVESASEPEREEPQGVEAQVERRPTYTFTSTVDREPTHEELRSAAKRAFWSSDESTEYVAGFESPFDAGFNAAAAKLEQEELEAEKDGPREHTLGSEIDEALDARLREKFGFGLEAFTSADDELEEVEEYHVPTSDAPSEETSPSTYAVYRDGVRYEFSDRSALDGNESLARAFDQMNVHADGAREEAFEDDSFERLDRPVNTFELPDEESRPAYDAAFEMRPIDGGTRYVENPKSTTRRPIENGEDGAKEFREYNGYDAEDYTKVAADETKLGRAYSSANPDGTTTPNDQAYRQIAASEIHRRNTSASDRYLNELDLLEQEIAEEANLIRRIRNIHMQLRSSVQGMNGEGENEREGDAN